MNGRAVAASSGAPCSSVTTRSVRFGSPLPHTGIAVPLCMSEYHVMAMVARTAFVLVYCQREERRSVAVFLPSHN